MSGDRTPWAPRGPRPTLSLAAWLIAWTTLAFWPQGGVSGQTIRGLVLEQSTSRPVELATVAMVELAGDTVAVAASDARGLYSVEAPKAGTYRLLVGALGYRGYSAGPYELSPGDLRVVEIGLEPLPVPVQGLDVEAEATTTTYLTMQGFDARRKMGFGRFLGPLELRALEGIVRRTEEIFDRIPGVSVGPRGGAVMTGTSGRPCRPVSFVDGVRVAGGEVERFAPFGDLEGIEVYSRPAQVPLRFSLAAQGCGVILYWTRH